MMKKNLILFFMLASTIASGQSQSFPGYRSGNFTGVNGVFFNPANIADSRYRWDINLFSINAGVGSNQTSYKLKNIDDAFDDPADNLFGNSDKKANGAVNFDVLGPSFMFNASRRLSFAITTRARALVNIKDIDGRFVRSVDESLSGTFPFTLSSNSHQKIAVNGWTDYGVSMGIVLADKGIHFLKGGITLKYLAGAANSFVSMNNFNATVNKNSTGDIYFTNTTGSVALGYSGYDMDNFNGSDAFKFNASGLGGDIGLVYEYRPDEGRTERYQNKYKIRAGIALLDMGRIKYSPKANEVASYSASITGTETWFPADLNGKSISEIKAYMDSRPALFTNNFASLSSYKVQLPSTVQANIDLSLNRGFFAELAGQLSVGKKNDTYSSFSYNSITFTPRYEGRAFGLYLPVNYNELTSFNAGVSLRAGPLFLGSGSVLTALLDKSKQADIHFGLRFGSLQKKAKKKKEAPIQEVTPVVQAPADTDGDGVNDEQDKCPAVKGLAKYNGCPVPDTDGDGINDEEDKCPSVRGTAKYNGCPVPDTDGDGINDEEDKCPSVRGTAKYNGCPVPDTDGDGINDEQDRCPTIAGVASNSGCPEVKAEIVKKVDYVAKSIGFRTGSAVLTATSNKQLNQLITVLQGDADLKLQIDGHTDNTGNAEKNRILSAKRAEAVKAYLVKKGIEESRLTSEGFGDTVPVADNKTATGRTKNRRVEMKLHY